MKSVLVTGGTTRLGKAISDGLRDRGWRVLTSSHRADAGADLVADLSAPTGADELFAAARAKLGGRSPDALVNNAALFTGEAARLEAVNFAAPKRLLELMSGRTGPRGAVVNVLDTRVLGEAAPSDRSVYASTKRAMLELTRTSAVRHAATLRVNAVAPGPVLPPTGAHEAAGTLLIARPTPEDVADAVAFLLEASSTTGCVIPVDGGQSLL